jgi:hypothetical protein
MSVVDGFQTLDKIVEFGNNYDEWKLDVAFDHVTLV